MTRIQKAVLWTVATCVFGYIAAKTLIIEAPRSALAQVGAPETSNGDPNTTPATLADESNSPPAASPTETREIAAEPISPFGVTAAPVPGAGPGSAGGPTVVYPVRRSAAEIVRQLQEGYRDKAEISADQRSHSIIVRGPTDIQSEIRGIITFLDRAMPPPLMGSQPAGGLAADPNQLELRQDGYGLPYTSVTEADTGDFYFGAAPRARSSIQQQIDAAVRTLRDARNDADKQTAKSQLRKLLESAFVEDMQARQTQVHEIETRLAKLRQQYQARETVKGEIIDLQIRVLENEAAGLGFPQAGSTGSRPNHSMTDSNSATARIPAIGMSPTLRFNNATDSNALTFAIPPGSQPGARPGNTPASPPEAKSKAEIAALKERGHFVESPDGKLYAYVNANDPAGPAVLHVADAATGKLVAIGIVPEVVGRLEFTNEGVATREADGALNLRARLQGRTPPVAGTPVVALSDAPSALNDASLPVMGSPNSTVVEFNLLRNQYLNAKAGLSDAEADFNDLLAQAREQNPGLALDDLKKQQPTLRRKVEQAQAAWVAAERLYETKLRLLKLELQNAIAARDAAKTKLARLTELYKVKVTTNSEVEDQHAILEAAEIEVERHQTILGLFESIKESAAPESNSSTGTRR